jgi:hypothetical protein
MIEKNKLHIENFQEKKVIILKDLYDTILAYKLFNSI